MDGWIPWRNWSLTNGWGEPRRLANGSNLTYELRSTSGSIAITIGSRLASWNGITVGLGFVPQFINGRPYIHALDAVKNFQPLVLPTLNLSRTNRVIVLDAGHGGENTGAKCVFNGLYEKELTLDWALRLEPLLSARGWKVRLSRTNDVDLTLPERVAFADQLQADFFLSLHFNWVDPAAGGREQSGLETYCLTPKGMLSNLTRDYEDDASRVFPNNAFDAENLQYAVRLHRTLLEATGQKDRGIRRARFMAVLREQNRPAVLLEGGYLSNPQEARLIGSVAYRQKLAEAVAEALE
ncbi:MAG: N-acetylmuramoyl-L-alanine amidase [Chloroflexi bacterium]|nr:N-acetylmuramoyl-L-alanine amidase [Chloroflexota bacterium]